MHPVKIFISCGSDVDRYRDTGKAAFETIEHMFEHELDYPIAVRSWDFRLDAPRIVRPEDMAARSLAKVEGAYAMVGIFGRRCPGITQREIRRAFELRRDGAEVEVLVFVNPNTKESAHDTFIREIRDEFGEQIVYQPYRNRLEFQARFLSALIPLLLKKTGIARPSLPERSA